MAGSQANIRTFIAPLNGPGMHNSPTMTRPHFLTPGTGRTAPALLEDLTLYDPKPGTSYGRNILRDTSRSNGGLGIERLGELFSEHSCQHTFLLKPKQSEIPPLDERPGPDSVWTAAAFCQKCRIHFHLKADYTVRFANSPCPNVERPCHHLISSEWRETSERNTWLRDHPESQDEIYTYECSSKTCSAAVTVRISPPALSDAQIHRLVDEDLLRGRTEEAFRTQEGNTQGMKAPSPRDVLEDLRAYIQNAWKEDTTKRAINLTNRRFIVRFGPDGTACKDLLEYLGFHLQAGVCWQVPKPDRTEGLPLQNNTNVFLDNVENELSALMLAYSAQDNHQAQDTLSLKTANRDFARVLSCQDYDKEPSTRATKLDPGMRTEPYIALGVPSDAADNLIIFAYQQNVITDRAGAPFYLTSLKRIATSRRSEALETALVLEQSKGAYDSDELAKAYQYFGLNMYAKTDDDHIIGLFESRLQDAKAHEHQMRDFLFTIGNHRNSRRIMDVSKNVMTTYEQALHFLGIDASTSDEHVQAVFAVKMADDASQTDMATAAVKLIAEHRSSQFLSQWIGSGFAAGNAPLDAAEGYQALRIDNRTIDDDLIITQYNLEVQDNPTNVEFYNRALMAIAEERNSSFLRNHLQQGAPATTDGTTEEPVGLENIGNTCYLNSLLQFLFTIHGLRQVVLNFDNYKMDPSEVNMSNKKVGQRKVTLTEVKNAQKFVASLASLFQGMIQTPQSSIRPEQELARLTLETDSAKEKLRRRSTLMSERPSLGHVNSQALLGPLSLPDTQANSMSNELAVQSPTDIDHKIFQPASGEPVTQKTESDAQAETLDSEPIRISDNSSEATLISRPGSVGSPAEDITTVDQQRAILEDKENLSPQKETFTPVEPHALEPLRPASPSKINAQAGALANKNETQDIERPQRQVVYAPPPGKPPPVPPRKPVETTGTTLEEYARQQDVQEVIAHCLFQLSCAMRPRGTDKSGEQLDEVHDLFFGQTVVHQVPEKVASTAIQFLNVICRVVNKPADLYAALDTEFDLSTRDNGTKAFNSISQLPPVFSIALDRVYWDKQLSRPGKDNHHVEIPETIYMDRYLEDGSDSELTQRRKQTWNTKQELSILQDRRDVLEAQHAKSTDLPSLFEDAKLVLEHLQGAISLNDDIGDDLDINPEIISTLGLMAEKTRQELDGKYLFQAQWHC